MNTFWKIILTSALVLFFVFALYGVFKAGLGNYFVNASFITSGLVIIGVIALSAILSQSIKSIWGLCIACLLLMQGCNYAKSNQQVVISDDCGMTWKKINAGDAVPKGVANPCYMKVVIPNFPMQGDSRFISNLKDRVRASIHIDYDYSIT